MAERPSNADKRIVRAAAELLTKGGRVAVSTRAVCAAAGVQPPAIYRQFGDMHGLLEAAARDVFAHYVRRKVTRRGGDDPLEDLRRGWDLHVSFGLANPDAYMLMYGSAALSKDAVAQEGIAVLQSLLGRVAAAGKLRVSVEHAARMVHAGGMGVTCSLIATPAADRDMRVSDAMRDAVIAAITVPPTKSKGKGKSVSAEAPVAARAVALRAALGEVGDAMSAGELRLLAEWLDRIANAER